MNVPLGWNYDSAGALNISVNAAVGALQISAGTPMGGWSLKVPSLNVTWSSFTDGEQPTPGVCTWESGFVFTDFQGQRHSLPLLHIETISMGGGVNQFACSNAGVQGFESDAGSDGEYQAALTTLGEEVTLSVSDSDGTIYQFVYIPNQVLLEG